jgi:outer membrane protein assembly factor BamD (BamD/ComL family)
MGVVNRIVSLFFCAGALVLSLLPLRSDPSDEENKAYHSAEQSFHEGAFDLCRDQIAGLLKRYPKTELAPQAEILQARALYQLGRSDAALAALNLPIAEVPPSLQAETLFWQGESLLELAKWPDAEQKYRALLALKDPAIAAGKNRVGQGTVPGRD